MTDEERLAAEQRACVLIDRQLTGAGWVVQDRRDLTSVPVDWALVVVGGLPAWPPCRGLTPVVNAGFAGIEVFRPRYGRVVSHDCGASR